MDNNKKPVKHRLTAAEKKKKHKQEKILRITGFVITAIQLLASVMLIVFLQYVNILPEDYKVMLSMLLVLFCVITLITQRWKIPGIITKVFSVLLSIIMLIGSYYINTTYHAIDKISGNKEQTANIGVYVLADDAAESIQDAAGYIYAIGSTNDRDNTDKMVEKINSELDNEISCQEYDGMTLMVDALYGGVAQAMILNTSYISVLADIDNYSDIESRLKCIMTYDITTDVEDDSNSDYLSSDDVLTLYVSGIDTDGAPTVNRNSDVNIIVVINKRTHQVLMINTPRDYYVCTTVSGDMPDKLTHAGCYGIDCSVGTLENLYGINIDHYLKVNFTGFVQIINELGGIDVNSDFDFVSFHGGYHFTIGNNHMDGDQALGFARERYAFPTGDNQRGKNQMAVIKGIIQKMESSDMLMNYSNVLEAVSASMTTSMSYQEITELVQMQIKENPSWDIQSYAVTGTGDNLACYSLSSPNYVMIPNYDTVNQAKNYLQQIFSGEIITVQ